MSKGVPGNRSQHRNVNVYLAFEKFYFFSDFLKFSALKTAIFFAAFGRNFGLLATAGTYCERLGGGGGGRNAGGHMIRVLSVAGVLDEPYSQLSPLSGVAVQARQAT
jgi:hypothetical protein